MLKKLTKLIAVLFLCMMLWPAQAKALKDPGVFITVTEENLPTEPSAPTDLMEPGDGEETEAISLCSDTYHKGDGL